MKTVLLVIKPDRYAQLSAEISGWLFDRAAEGWSASVYQTAQTSGYGLRADLRQLWQQKPFDHVFLVGAVPSILVDAGENTHYLEWLTADSYLVNTDPDIDTQRVPGTDECNQPGMATAPYAHVGRLSFDGLTGDIGNGLSGLSEDEQLAQYRLWFARRHQHSIDQGRSFPRKVLFDDHLGGDALKATGDAVVAEFASQSGLLNHLSLPAITQWDDGFLKAQQDSRISIVHSGGFEWQALYYVGYWYDLMACPIQSPIAAFFGSFMVDTWTSDSFIRFSLVDKTANPKKCRVVAALYNHYGLFPFAMLIQGATLGQAATEFIRRLGGIPIKALDGDPTTTIDLVTDTGGDDLSSTEAIALQAEVDDLKAWRDNAVKVFPQLGQQVNVPPPPPPSTIKRNCGNNTPDGWLPDNGVGGSIQALNGQPSTDGVANAAPAAVYSSARIGQSLAFKEAKLAPGAATLRLHGADSWPPGRSAKVTVNGVVVLPAWNIAQLAGYNKACVTDTPITIGADGLMNMTVEGANNAILCAYEVIPA